MRRLDEAPVAEIQKRTDGWKHAAPCREYGMDYPGQGPPARQDLDKFSCFQTGAGNDAGQPRNADTGEGGR